MRIGVISDTHIPTRVRQLPPELFTLFAGVDLILHAGDMVEEYVLQELAAIAPVEAVAGNTDSWELHNRFGRKKILELAGYNIGLIHGDGGTDTRKTLHALSEDAFFLSARGCRPFGGTSFLSTLKIKGESPLTTPSHRIVASLNDIISYARPKTPQRALQAFKQDRVDCIIFGHSHQPYHETVHGILLFNPGSPTDRRREPRHSCGLLTLGKTITAQLLYLPFIL